MRSRSLVMLLAGFSLLAATAPALAQNSFKQFNLVADETGKAALTDSNLVNAWGLVPSAGGIFWASDNGTGRSTLYRPDGSIVPLVVEIPGGSNTGVDVTDANAEAFEIPSGDSTARALFIFVTENGTISAWSNRVDATHAILVATTPDAVYKGVALARTASGPRLYAANFHAGMVDVFDNKFHPVSLPGAFTDPNLPAGYAPFNVANIAGQILVTYAQQDDERHDENDGAGFGFIDVYDRDGVLLRRLVSQGPLNAPWGMALAPPSFGPFGDKLLVGNFGDGRINVFSVATGAFEGSLEDGSGNPIVIDGLWGLHFGAAASGPQVANRLYFAAGPERESHGLFGYLATNGAEVCVNRAADVDFWEDQCERADRKMNHGAGELGMGEHGFKARGVDADSLRALFDCVTLFSRSFVSGGCFVAGCDLLAEEHHHVDARTRAAEAFLALELDRCAGIVCDSAVVSCGSGFDRDDDALNRGGDGEDHHGGDGHRGPGSGSRRTVSDIIGQIDTSLCAAQSEETFETLTRLAECAIRTAHGTGGHGGDEVFTTPSQGSTNTMVARVDVRPIGVSPAHLSSGLGVRFMVSAPSAAPVRLGIYDAAGRLVAQVLRDAQFSSPTVVRWDGTNQHGVRVASGTYFYRAVAGNTAVGGRIVVVH